MFYSLQFYKVCTFFLIKKKKIIFEKDGNKFFLKKWNETDTSLYFLTVEKVMVSLLTKCLSRPTIGSALIGYFMSHRQDYSHQLFNNHNVDFVLQFSPIKSISTR